MDVSMRMDGSSDGMSSGGGGGGDDDSEVAVDCYRTESVGFGRACDDKTRRVEVPFVLGTSSSSVRAAPWTYNTQYLVSCLACHCQLNCHFGRNLSHTVIKCLAMCNSVCIFRCFGSLYNIVTRASSHYQPPTQPRPAYMPLKDTRRAKC